MYNSHRDGPHVEAAPVLFWVFFWVLPSLVLKTLHHSARPSCRTFRTRLNYEVATNLRKPRLVPLAGARSRT